MSLIELQSWTDLNHRYLSAALAELRARIEGGDDLAGTLPDLAARMPAPPAIEALRQMFGLSSFERDLLLLCAGVELDAGFARAVAGSGESGLTLPTFAMAMAVLEKPHWSALSPAGPLRRWHLIRVMDGHSLTASPLRITERVLHFLTGVQYIDDEIAGMVETVAVEGPAAPSHEKLAGEIHRVWAAGNGAALPPLIQLIASEAGSARLIASAAAARLGMQLAAMRADDLPSATVERERITRILEREAALGSLVLLVDYLDFSLTPGDEWPVLHFLGHVACPVIVLTPRRLDVPMRQSVHLTVKATPRNEHRALWEAMLGESEISINGQLGRIAGQFRLSPGDIRAISTELVLTAGKADPDEPADRLWDLCRERTSPRIDGLAQRIEPVVGWDDLVLPPMQKQTLRDIAVHVRERNRVYDEWGFGHKAQRGLGISALFSGPSGTGKTMAAEVLAAELRLDLYRIDLSQVVSKYIGETEKNLSKLFDAAEGGGVILLFDEADALFGKRSEVRDSHDRYANIEVSYLLQRMEAYDGLAILTTNLKAAIDQAFMRRIRFIVQFPFPDAEARAAIWRGVFPAETPVQGLDYSRLARLNVAGGNIRNIALNAAFLAAGEDQPVCMRHLLRAARAEAIKLDRPLSDAEIRGWV